MNPLKKKEIAEQIWNLELKCQSDKDISKEFDKMDNIMNKLSFKELLEVILYIEENYVCKKSNFMI